jgi:hypothetical protein
MSEIVLFEIPIYLRTFDQWYNDYVIDRDKFVRLGYEPDFQLTKEQIDTGTFQYEYFFWKEWYYNDVIAWARIVVDMDKIIAERHALKAKRLSKKMKNRIFINKGKYWEADLCLEMTSNQIADILINIVNKICSSEKKHFVDRTAFDLLVNNVDWVKVLFQN